MKNIIGFIIAAFSVAACNSTSSKIDSNKDSVASAATDTAQTIQPVAQAAAAVFPAKELIAGYLQLKNALAKDDGKEAAIASNALLATLAKADTGGLTDGQKNAYRDIGDDMKEHAEHIGANAAKLAHQREHFEILSKDMADLVKAFGNGGQILYIDFCPMYNNGKGAAWLSEVKEIKNPYLGNAMATCGTVKETIQ